jgi:AraC family transcriptional regulator
MDHRRRALLEALALIAREQPRGNAVTQVGAVQRLSAHHAHRTYRRLCNETPNETLARVSLSRAAAALLTTDKTVLSVALDAGYQSHEAFTRAFVRRYGITPTAYRRRANPVADASHHSALVASIGPCVKLYRLLDDSHANTRRTTGELLEEDPYMVGEIELRHREDQPMLVVRRRVRHAEIQPALADAFPQVYEYAVRSGAGLAGPPTCGYREWSSGGVTLEAGLPVTTPVEAEGDVEPAAIPGGQYAVAVHHGSYDSLDQTHAALEDWLQAYGYRAETTRYEVYLTDPGQYPNPEDWRTEILAPIAG